MKQFYEKVDMRSRKSMTDFLMEHFRYNTMNSWNRSTSYACNIKIHRLGLDRETTDKLYNLIETSEFWDDANLLFEEFAQEHNYDWQIGTNGRSGGYMVLYQGGRKPSGYKSHCTACWQSNYKTTAESGTKCGKCGQQARVDDSVIHMNVFTYPGKSLDQGEDFFDWDLHELRDRVQLVCEFDKIADNFISLAVYMVKENTVEDEIYYEPRTRKVLVPVGS